jgi:hypothetical protein
MSPQANKDILTLPTDGSLSHNWLYSFLPVGRTNEPSLVGFCKQCRHTFIYFLPVDTAAVARRFGYNEYDSKIPKYGCIPAEDV